MAVLFEILLTVTAVFLVVLVLIQRGKGGGLAGALGGMGGQSAFGTKAGDLFTRITIGVATFWIILCIATVKLLGTNQGPLEQDIGNTVPNKPGVNAPLTPGKPGEKPADTKPAEGKPAESKPAAPAKAPAGK